MSGLKVGHVWQTPLKPGLGGQIYPDFLGKLDWK
jgi:hypothetical protein